MFDEIVINRLLKREIDQNTYTKLSDKVKRDPRIVRHFIKSNPSNINFLQRELLLQLVTNNNQLISYLDSKNLNSVFLELDLSRVPFNKEIYVLLNEDNKGVLFNYSPSLVLSIAPREEIVTIISKVISANNNEKKGYYYDKSYYLSDDDLKKLILDSNKDVMLLLLNDKDSQKFAISVIESLSEEQQIELCIEHKEFLDYVDEDIQDMVKLHNANGDLFEIALLHPSVQVEYYKKHKDHLRYASSNTVYNFLLNNQNDSLTYDQFRTAIFNKGIAMGRIIKSANSLISLEERLKLFSNNFYFVYQCIRGSEDSYSLDKVVMAKIETISDVEERKKLIDLYSSLTGEKINNDIFIYHNDKYQIARMIFDDKIIENNDSDLLKEYSNGFKRETLIDILTNAYGEHVREIFNQRPNLDLLSIQNFKIFDKTFVDNLGMGFVHYALSYDFSESQEFISILSNDEEKMMSFKKYYDYVLENNKDFDIGTMSDILIIFNSHETLLSTIDYESLTDKQKATLELILIENNPISLAVRNINDIDRYIDTRKKYFQTKYEKQEYPSEKQNCIFEYITGRVVDEKLLTIENIGLENIIKVFNVDHIVRNESLITSIGLNNDEVAILLLLHKISRINNSSILDDIFTAVMSSSINPIMFKETFDKIKTYYTDTFKERLTTKEEINNMKKEYIDGIPVVSFEGEPLNIVCSITDLNMSSGGNFLQPTVGKKLLNDWLHREKGSSAISAVLCSSDVSIYPAGEDFGHKGIIFAFDEDVSIIAMGGSDISYTHTKNTSRHEFDYIGVSKMRFSSMEEIKSDMFNSLREDKDKFPGEVTIRRKEEDIRAISGIQPRRMPMGIYVVGDITSEQIETAKAFNKYYKENGLGEFQIIKVNPNKYSSVPIVSKPKEQDDVVKSDIGWYQEIESHISSK